MKKKILFCLLNIFATATLANIGDPKHFIVSPGIARQHNWTADINLMYVSYTAGPCGYSMDGPRLGAEFVFTDSKIICAPKIGYEGSGMILCFRASEINYLYDGKIDARLLAEAGIDFVTGGSLCYGYNFHVLGEKYDQISDHRLTLTVNLFLTPRQ